MKIGIISFWDTTNNYGQILQCFALQKFLRNLGHDAVHIKYQLPWYHKTNKKKSIKFLNIIKDFSFVRLISHKLLGKGNVFYNLHAEQTKQDKIHPRHFESFRKKYIKFTDLEYDYNALKDKTPKVDCLITGSDQVWGNQDPGFMLDFGPDNIKRIAYAPSMGGIRHDKTEYAETFRKRLRKLDVVTCREQEGVDICRKLGRKDTELVPDPVFLLSRKEYEQIAVLPSQTDYLLIYLLGNPIDVPVKKIIDWAKTKKLYVKYVVAQGRQDVFVNEYPNVDEFLGLVKNAAYVITNSFHGMVISIIFNKKFIIIPLSKQLLRMNSRIETTLLHLGLSDRIYTDSFDSIFSPIDYLSVNLQLEKQRKKYIEKFKIWLR